MLSRVCGRDVGQLAALNRDFIGYTHIAHVGMLFGHMGCCYGTLYMASGSRLPCTAYTIQACILDDKTNIITHNRH